MVEVSVIIPVSQIARRTQTSDPHIPLKYKPGVQSHPAKTAERENPPLLRRRGASFTLVAALVAGLTGCLRCFFLDIPCGASDNRTIGFLALLVPGASRR